MSVAAYNRGSKAISDQIAREARSPEWDVMGSLNATRRHADARMPWGPIHFVKGHGGWWAECPKRGFGYHYPTLRAAIAAFHVTIVSYDATTRVWGRDPWRCAVEAVRLVRGRCATVARCVAPHHRRTTWPTSPSTTPPFGGWRRSDEPHHRQLLRRHRGLRAGARDGWTRADQMAGRKGRCLSPSARAALAPRQEDRRCPLRPTCSSRSR